VFVFSVFFPSRRLGLFQMAAFSEICNVVCTNKYYSALMIEYDPVRYQKSWNAERYKAKLQPQHPFGRVTYHLAKPIEKESYWLIEGVLGSIEKSSDLVLVLIPVLKTV
jgi:hypothetical protein